METFELILLLLAVILISTIFAQFIPRVSLPLVQIGLGMLVALLSFTPLEFHVDPELFLILFIAPLLFDESRHVNKRDLWNNKVSIISLALGLVLLTVLVVGFVLHFFIPSLPLAAAFALGAALGPTDAVAVSALSKDVSLSARQKSILSGESLINDASGVVSFQFAIAAAVTGAFSIVEASETFALSFLGGIAMGLILGAAGTVALRLLRDRGLESTTTHVLFELFLPFIVFLIAEHLHVSGILAVVAAGLFITLIPQKITPMVSQLNIISKSVWEVVVFVINGVLFVMLGMELPRAFMAEWDTEHVNTNLELIGYVLLVTSLIVVIRFIWIICMDLVSEKRSGKRSSFRVLLQNALVTTLAGPKGAISLSIAFTIPVFVSSGMIFPYRDLLIFIASGTILCTLLLANFLVPLLAPKKNEEAENQRMLDIEIEILQNVVKELRANQDSEAKVANGIVIRHYKDRIRQLRQKETNNSTLKRVRLETMDFQEDRVKRYLEEGSVDKEIGTLYLKRLALVKNMMTRNKRIKRLVDTALAWRRDARRITNSFGETTQEEETHKFRRRIEKDTVAYLERRLEDPDSSQKKCLQTLLAEHKSVAAELEAETELFARYDPAQALTYIQDVESEGLRIELGEIQSMYENDRLNRAEATTLREEVYLMQANLSNR